MTRFRLRAPEVIKTTRWRRGWRPDRWSTAEDRTAGHRLVRHAAKEALAAGLWDELPRKTARRGYYD